jgi:hypothetical protein
MDEREEGATDDDDVELGATLLNTLLEAAPQDFTNSHACCQCAPVPGA